MGGSPILTAGGPSTTDAHGQCLVADFPRAVTVFEGHWLRPGALLSVISNIRKKARCCQGPPPRTAPEDWDQHCHSHLSPFPRPM